MSRQLNIVYMICHDMGQYLGAYGIDTVQTPNLDRIAEEGVLFENNFCTAPQCSPSRASLMTGRYPHSNGVYGLSQEGMFSQFHANEKPMANLLHDAGYDSYKFGLQHATYDESFLKFKPYRQSGGEKECTKVAGSVIEFLKERKAQEQHAPFFAHVGFFEPHRPFDFEGAEPDSALGVSIPPYIKHTPEAEQDFAMFQGAIKKVDQAIGRVYQAIQDLGYAEDTLVIFTVDHGFPFFRAKGTLYDPGLKTALLMRCPRYGITGGKRYTQLISNIDLLPTVLEAAGISIPEQVQGKSFWSLLTGKPYQPNKAVFAEKTYHNSYDPMRAIRTEHFKLIFNFESTHGVQVPGDVAKSLSSSKMLPELFAPIKPFMELYDLKLDPWESKNLAQEPEYETIKQELAGRLYQWMADTQDPLLNGPIPSASYNRRLACLKGLAQSQF